MDREKSNNGISIPMIAPIVIIIGILLIVFCGGTELISNSAKYQTANATATDLSDFELKKLEDGSYEITKYNGNDASVVIPSATETRVPITSIGLGAFAANKSVKSVQISQGITNIGKKAFYSCSNLVSINIPDLVTSIGDYAFSGTNLTRLRLPESVTNIGEYAFDKCYNLYEINIPKGVTSIEPATFRDCAFESIDIPEGVTSIGYYAFASCKNLTNIELPEKLETINSYAFIQCNALTCVVIPNGVAWIDYQAFYNCKNLSKLIIPDSVVKFASTEGAAIYDNGTIYCKSGSAAEKYAKTYGGLHKIECITDIELPKINNITINPTEWTNEKVVITVDAEDAGVGLYRKAYSFDGGKTWQEENTKIYTENTNGIIIAVKDNLGNTATYEKIIDITNIDKEAPEIFGVTKSTEEPTKGTVTLTVDAADDISDFSDLAYSFDGGFTWQTNNSKEYIWNTNGIKIQVKDKAENIAIYEDEINITNIIELKELKVVTPPGKTEYYARENFDKTGMVVVAVYENGDEDITTDYTIEGEMNMLCSQTLVVLRSKHDIYISAEIPITMKHLYRETVVEPTCTEQGYTTKKCEACNIPTIKENYVDALGHSFTKYESNKDATCTTDGTKTAKCDRCDETKTIEDEGSAIGHDWFKKSETAPSCTGYGIEGYECTRCLCVEERKGKAPIGHSFTKYQPSKIATCTEDGLKTAICDRCNEEDTIVDVGSAKGHKEVVDLAIEPTCSQTGLTEGKHCSTCKEELIKQEVIKALGHDHKATVTEPTCTEQGYTTHKCTRCDDTYVDTYVDALGHKYEDLKCTVCKKEAPRISIETDKYEISEEKITKIPNKITVNDFKENITTTNTTEIKIYNKDNKELKDEDAIGTGATIVLKSEFETKTYKLVVEGDVTGDGVADFKDIVAINRHRLNKKLLEGEYLKAGDVTGDGIADFKDIVKINRFRLGKILELFSTM